MLKVPQRRAFGAFLTTVMGKLEESPTACLSTACVAPTVKKQLLVVNQADQTSL